MRLSSDVDRPQRSAGAKGKMRCAGDGWGSKKARSDPEGIGSGLRALRVDRVWGMHAELGETNCWHPHQLRHNYATMIRQRFGVEQAQNMLDHSSVGVTLIYAERNRERAIEIALAVG